VSTTIARHDLESRGAGGSGVEAGDAKGLRVEQALIRAIDLTICVGLLLLLSWLFLLIALVVRLTSPGPAIFRQSRVGYMGRVFTVYKFRTMRATAGDAAHAAFMRSIIGSNSVRKRPLSPGDRRLFKLTDDRITRVGRFLRRTSLDELPQVWNVVRGDMSLVGPRPVVVYEAEMYPDWYHERFRVKPGLTGLWQVSGRDMLSYDAMVALDIEFVSRRSLGLYLSILVRTVPALLRIETA
jgi:lipopolysaccharide/colanic/teichoic acid biosynthesis glycosyltransferase